FLAGTMIPALWVQQAHRFRSWFRAMMSEMFENLDIILTPTTPFAALPSGTKTITLDGQVIPARPNIGLFTQPFSFIGLARRSGPARGAPSARHRRRQGAGRSTLNQEGG
ncbi:MAG: AtzE family amidohydrolase, partial [Roseibium sp.]